MIRAKFKINKMTVYGDFRPLVWYVSYPYWHTGTTPYDFCMVAYAEDLKQIFEQWPDAKDISYEEVNEIKYTPRFPKPKWCNKTGYVIKSRILREMEKEIDRIEAEEEEKGKRLQKERENLLEHCRLLLKKKMPVDLDY